VIELREQSESTDAPFGISFLAFLIIMQGFVFILLLIPGSVFSYMNGYLNGIQIIGTAFLAICIFMNILLGNGLFDMKRWAWFGSVGYVFLWTLYFLYTGIVIGISENLNEIMYCAIIIGYLALPDTRNRFS
jgi:hypothetical protein